MAMRRITKALADPGMVPAWLAVRLRPGTYRARMTRLARRCGLTRPVFVVSFDCDTDEDTAVLPSLHRKLRAAGLSPTYAACGEVIAAAPSVYRNLALDGADLLNHGFRRHAIRDPRTGRVTSNFFYDGRAPEVWREDIRLGHQALTALVGRPPRGFRTPHFGTFEAPQELDALWHTLAQMGYTYSSSTRPLAGWRFGPAFQRHGIMELPATGCIDNPVQIVDSWGLVRATGTSVPLTTALESYRRIMSRGCPMLLNIYLDPADIANDDGVLSALAGLAPYDRGGFDGALAEVRRS
ncbi:MAG: polysaccharide deacetylase family protein [Alphaproteobacteria bacterium]